MLKFLLHKMKNKKWMVISLLMGNLLMVAIATANPMYSKAVLQRTLTQDMKSYLVENNRYPGTIAVEGSYSPFLSKSFNELEEIEGQLEEMILEMEVPVLASSIHYGRNNVVAVHGVKVQGEKSETQLQLAAYSGFEDHIQIIYGEMFTHEVTDHVIEVVVTERTYKEQKLFLGEELTLSQMTDRSGIPYKVRVVGVFEAMDDNEAYWISSPSYLSRTMMMSDVIFEERIVSDGQSEWTYDKSWHVVLDDAQMCAERTGEMIQVTEKYLEAMENGGAKKVVAYYLKTLKTFADEAQKVKTTISVLQVPIFMLLAAFVFMVSRQMLEMEQNEISVFKSRGATKGQILRIYLLQSVMIVILGLAGGMPLGVLICRVLGASNAFLEFVNRAALPIELDATVWLYGLIAAVFSVGTMVLPVIRFADVNIVAHKRGKNRKGKWPWWQMIFLDVVLIGVAFYGLYQFKGQEEYLALQVAEGASLDPMLYISSSLFMLGCALLILRLLPWMVRLVFELGKRWWSPSAYTSFLRILRTKQNQGFLVVFLVITVAMGIFNTSTARSINANGEEKLRYSIGADVVLQERWGNNSAQIKLVEGDLSKVIYIEPDFGKYEEMDGIAKATKVLVDEESTVTVSGEKLSNVTVMGIHTREFGEVAWFKEALLARHWYHYLNDMSQNASAILVSSNFRELYGYEEGDLVNYTNSQGVSVRGIIYGFVDYWPGYSPKTRVLGNGGIYVESDHFLIVAHLSQLQAAWDVTPYQIWIKTEGSSQFLYDYAEENGITFEIFEDVSKQLVELKNDPVFQGTNGVLTIGFIIVLLLCAAGFLIYWILSIQSRTLQFGIFRAMGMSKKEILSMLVYEQIFVSGSAILGGALVGQICSDLFVPVIQIAYSSADRVIPLEIISEVRDYLRLGSVIGCMILLCMVILGMLISKIRITQALKLGED